MEKLKINYHVTEACNFRCKFCFAKYTNKTLGFEEQKAVIKKIAQSNLFEKINFIGGEPLLDKNIVALIKYSFELGLKVSMNLAKTKARSLRMQNTGSLSPGIK